MEKFIKLKADGKIRFRCTFCLALLETELNYCAPLDCPGCNRKIFVPKSPFEPDCVMGDFVIREKIGQGSLGTVYKAIQISLEREVALKILLPELTTTQVAADFLREARAAAKLIHINLVLAYAVGEENGVYYMAMNYINGESLKTKLRREGCIAVDEALHIVQQVAEALHYAWEEAKLIHRDVKPDNIMITCDGIVKLADLGLAIKQTECGKDMEIAGTPIYMSPEQFSGESLDSRSDIYSLGVTLYQMLSGNAPFQAETVKSMARQHFTETAVPLHKLGLGIPQSVSFLVKRMIEKLPEDRFSDMEALLKAILAARQSTAHDKDLVPALHTCSVSRLKYQSPPPPVQHPKKDQGQTQVYARMLKPETNLKASRNYLFRGMLIAFPLMSIMLALVLLRPAIKEPEETALLKDRLVQLETKLTNPELPPAGLTAEAEELLKQFPAKHTLQQEALYWKLKNHITGLNYAAQKAIDLEAKSDAVKKLEAELKVLLAAKADNDNKLAGEIKKNKTAESTITSLNGRLKELESKITILKSNSAAETARQQALYDKYWKADVLNDLYQQLKAKDYAMAEACLTYKRLQYGQEHNAWFNSYIEWIKHLHQLDAYFDTGNSYFVGQSVGGCKITLISSGNIYFEEKDGDTVVKSCKWYEFSPQGIYILLKRAKPELAGERKVFEGDVTCLKDDIFLPAAIKGRPFLKELCLAVIDRQIESILSVAIYDKKQAASAAGSLLYVLKNTEFVSTVKGRLENLLKQNGAAD